MGIAWLQDYQSIKTKGNTMNVIQCYAPISDSSKDRDQFYEWLRQNLVVLMGDLYAKVEMDSAKRERTMGQHGLGERN